MRGLGKLRVEETLHKSNRFLEALDIYPDKEDESKHGWCQIKMMFQGKERQALQTLLENNHITPEDQLTPSHTLNVIQTSI